jgi:hypothetical protein
MHLEFTPREMIEDVSIMRPEICLLRLDICVIEGCAGICNLSQHLWQDGNSGLALYPENEAARSQLGASLK